jgi:hypothetical protein
MTNTTTATICNEKNWLTNPSLELVKSQTAEPQGNRHNPIKHYDALRIFHDTVANRELDVTGNFSMMSKDGMKYLFIVDVKLIDADYTFTFGFVNSNDRSKAFTILLGEKVFICSNMMFGGQLDDLKRRHCGDIYSEVSDRCELGVERFFSFCETRTEVFKRIDNPIQRLDSQRSVNALFKHQLDIPIIDA